ncbi:MAG: dihydroneopterin aldolase [Oceanococcus sp.]
MSDWVFVHGLKADTVIGVFDWERRIRQRVVFDLDMQVDVQAAGRSDELRHTVDYAAVSERVMAFTSTARYELIESLAEAVAALLLKEFAMQCVRIRLSKPGAVAQAENVGVLIERQA